MSRLHLATDTLPGGFPRVSGDEPTEMNHIADKVWFSPRERG